MRYHLSISLLVIIVLGSNNLLAAEKPTGNNTLRFENDQLILRASPRSPEQISAFYEGRKFPANMIGRLRQECFITIGIHNKSGDVLWHDLKHWRFTSGKQTLKRYHRNDWKPVWNALAVPMSSQSTFRWTQLPETLDFRPGEREGGNIILQRTDKPFDIHARFVVGKDKHGTPVDVTLKNVTCARDAK